MVPQICALVGIEEWRNWTIDDIRHLALSWFPTTLPMSLEDGYSTVDLIQEFITTHMYTIETYIGTEDAFISSSNIIKYT